MIYLLSMVIFHRLQHLAPHPAHIASLATPGNPAWEDVGGRVKMSRFKGFKGFNPDVVRKKCPTFLFLRKR